MHLSPIINYIYHHFKNSPKIQKWSNRQKKHKLGVYQFLMKSESYPIKSVGEIGFCTYSISRHHTGPHRNFQKSFLLQIRLYIYKYIYNIIAIANSSGKTVKWNKTHLLIQLNTTLFFGLFTSFY